MKVIDTPSEYLDQDCPKLMDALISLPVGKSLVLETAFELIQVQRLKQKKRLEDCRNSIQVDGGQVVFTRTPYFYRCEGCGKESRGVRWPSGWSGWNNNSFLDTTSKMGMWCDECVKNDYKRKPFQLTTSPMPVIVAGI